MTKAVTRHGQVVNDLEPEIVEQLFWDVYIFFVFSFTICTLGCTYSIHFTFKFTF